MKGHRRFVQVSRINKDDDESQKLNVVYPTDSQTTSAPFHLEKPQVIEYIHLITS